MEATEIRFTSSVAKAFRAVIKLMTGMLTDRQGVSQPIPPWIDYWFDRVEMSKIIRGRRVEPEGGLPAYWEVGRNVKFFVRGQRVAEVGLVGMHYDGDPHDSAATLWRVDLVWWVSEMIHQTKEPLRWKSLRLEDQLTDDVI